MTQKYEREIEEILRNLDDFVPEEPMQRRVSRRARSWWHGVNCPAIQWRNYFRVQWLMVASLGLVMLGFLLRLVSHQVAWYVNLLGLVLFIAAIIVSVFHLGGRHNQTRWRGQVMDLSDGDWWGALRRRWRLWWRKRGHDRR